MLLSQYLAQTRLLLANPAATAQLYPDSALTNYINLGRKQVAIETECVRAVASLTITAPIAEYAISAINPNRVDCIGVISVRQAALATGSAGLSIPMEARPWEWFNSYVLQNPSNVAAAPYIWAIFEPGQQGTIFVNPPDTGYVLRIDAACMPVDLVDDTTADAIPYPWQDAVPHYAAFYAYMSAQRSSDADKAYQRYEEFVNRARLGTTPSQYSRNATQSGSPGSVKTGVMTIAPLPTVGPQGGARS